MWSILTKTDIVALTISEICLFIRTDGQTDRQTDGHGYIDSAVDADQEYIYFMGSETPPSACYILLTSPLYPSEGIKRYAL